MNLSIAKMILIRCIVALCPLCISGASQANDKPLWGMFGETGEYWSKGGQGYVVVWNYTGHTSAILGYLEYCQEKGITENKCIEHTLYIFSKGVREEKLRDYGGIEIYYVRKRCILITELGGDVVRMFYDNEQEARQAYERELDSNKATGNLYIGRNMKEIVCNAR